MGQQVILPDSSSVVVAGPQSSFVSKTQGRMWCALMIKEVSVRLYNWFGCYEVHPATASSRARTTARPPAGAAANVAADTVANHVADTNLSEEMLQRIDIGSLKS
jgi:hypothetical protein